MSTEAEIIQWLNTSLTFNVQTCESITHMQIGYERGDTLEWNLSTIQGANIFKGAGVVSAKFGTLEKGKFKELPNGEVEILKTGTNETMSKKTKTKKTQKAESNGKVGKIQFVESLLDGKLTKTEIAERLTKEYGVPEKTARNTVNWTASTMKKRTKKEPKFKAEERVNKPEGKPAKKKAKKKIVAVETVTEPAAITAN